MELHDFKITILAQGPHLNTIVLLHCEDCGKSYLGISTATGGMEWKNVPFDKAPGICSAIFDASTKEEGITK